MANHIQNSDDSNFEITSKRRKGFPSVDGGANMYEKRRFEIALGSISGKGKPAVLGCRFVGVKS